MSENFHATQNKAWAEDKNKFAYKMMVKMGWTEGKGLGANEVRPAARGGEGGRETASDRDCDIENGDAN